MLKSYGERPDTPLGPSTGLTSTPVSRHPSRSGTPNQILKNAMVDPYRYQPAAIWSHPNCYPCSSSNYREALRSRAPLGGTSGDDKENEPEGGRGDSVLQNLKEVDGEKRHPLSVEISPSHSDVEIATERNEGERI
jgi:hypothetical protein